MIRSSHAAQDFTYPSLADFIRAALQAYKDGMVLTELDQNGPKRVSEKFAWRQIIGYAGSSHPDTSTTLTGGRLPWKPYQRTYGNPIPVT
jgi:hypothetical protein